MRHVVGFAVALLTLTAAAPFSQAQPYAQQWREPRQRPPGQVWCLVQNDFGNSQCTFYSRRQCEASKAGLNDACVPGARGQPAGGFRRF